MNNIVTLLTKEFKNKKVLIVGLGLQGGGVGLVKFFAQLGARVKVTDLKRAEELKDSLEKIKEYDIDLILGRHLVEDFLWADVIFKGPSVPWNLPYLQKATTAGIPIEMEASFFTSHCPCPIIGVTGTRGKSTTTMMIEAIMKQSGFSVFVGGNVAGTSTIAILEKVTKKDYVLLELSSWQLSGFHRKKISPHIAVLTNLYPDHLNFYGSMKDYFHDKKAIYQYQNSGDFLIVHKSLKSHINPPFNQTIIFTSGREFGGQLSYLQGAHNYDNASQAYEVARILKIDASIAYCVLADFKPLPHRLEKIATIAGVEVYNDTTSTTPIACEKAVTALKNRNIILILGGNSKKLPYEKLILTINKLVKKIVLLKGSFTDEIYRKLDKTKLAHENPYDDLESAFNQAILQAQPSDVILLSPAATSFTMFQNEFHRGEEFNRVVKAYEKKTS